MNPNRKINVLWLDDELEHHPKWYADLMGHMNRKHPDVRLLPVHTVEDFARNLQLRAHLAKYEEHYIDWMWLDVMIKPLQLGETFACLGFPEEHRIATVVGAQILGLMQNATPPLEQGFQWLTHYKGRPTSLLTSLLTIHSDWGAYLDANVRRNTQYFAAMVKQFDYRTNVVEVDEELKAHIAQRVALCKRLVEDSPAQDGVSS